MHMVAKKIFSGKSDAFATAITACIKCSKDSLVAKNMTIKPLFSLQSLFIEKRLLLLLLHHKPLYKEKENC